MPNADTTPRTPGLEEFEREARNFDVIAAAGGGCIEAQTARAHAKMFRDVSEGVARLTAERDVLDSLTETLVSALASLRAHHRNDCEDAKRADAALAKAREFARLNPEGTDHADKSGSQCMVSAAPLWASSLDTGGVAMPPTDAAQERERKRQITALDDILLDVQEDADGLDSETRYPDRRPYIDRILALLGAAPSGEPEPLRAMLVTCREALESLPQDALGEGVSVETHPDGQAGQLRWPIRDELIDGITRTLNGASALTAAPSRGLAEWKCNICETGFRVTSPPFDLMERANCPHCLSSDVVRTPGAGAAPAEREGRRLTCPNCGTDAPNGLHAAYPNGEHTTPVIHCGCTMSDQASAFEQIIAICEPNASHGVEPERGIARIARAAIAAAPREQGPDARLGGRWVPSGELSPVEIAEAQAKCGGMDWFVNDAGLGWAWLPDDVPDGFGRLKPEARAEIRDFAEWLTVPGPKPEFHAWRKERTPEPPAPGETRRHGDSEQCTSPTAPWCPIHGDLTAPTGETLTILCGRCDRVIPGDHVFARCPYCPAPGETREPMPTRFTFDLYWSDEDEAYVAQTRSPARWGIAAHGDTPHEAVRQYGEALSVALDDPDLTPVPAAPTGEAARLADEEAIAVEVTQAIWRHPAWVGTMVATRNLAGEIAARLLRGAPIAEGADGYFTGDLIEWLELRATEAQRDGRDADERRYRTTIALLGREDG